MDADRLAAEHYAKKFDGSLEKAFVHLAKEMGELARAIEKSQPDVARHELAELAGLLFFFARHYGFDLLASTEELYRKKHADGQTTAQGR